jgi:diguanylate cyclase with GGDEF domain/PucR-like helix-turn-helix protein
MEPRGGGEDGALPGRGEPPAPMAVRGNVLTSPTALPVERRKGWQPGGRREAPAALRARRAEIEQEVLNRIHAISDPSRTDDPGYLEGLRVAVSATIDYGFGALEGGEERPPPVPLALLVQARNAARHGVSLDTVLRRYFAGYRLFVDVLFDECAHDRHCAEDLKRSLRALSARFDHVVAAVSEEFGRETSSRSRTMTQRRVEHVESLLRGELLDHVSLGAELSYDFGGHHLGLFVAGPSAVRTIRGLATALDCRPLTLIRPEHCVWAWLGAHRPLDPTDLQARLGSNPGPSTAFAIGEPGEGLAGWRLTHRQARAALPIAQRTGRGVVRYREVALVASISQDELLRVSLRQIYLQPLEEALRDKNGSARKTLDAYITAGRNVTSTAIVLGVKRHTVTRRLRRIEDKLGLPLDACMAELELTLRLDDLTVSSR